ncbi:hypothetical protein F4801DRAFT_362325 [Xylaria longipes]|nr:hypothetical protein F4801DRAFT_362325 [Xylaria longipes]
MCIQYDSTYPCGHVKSRWELCNRAKAVNLLRLGKPNTPCDRITKKVETADLSDICGSPCLSRPYQCNKCNSPQKQLAWLCVDCKSLRDNNVLVWDACECSRHICSESVLGTSLCKRCLDECMLKES